MIELTQQNILKADLVAGAVVNVNKPLGLTSFAVVRKIRGWSQVKKVGHAGTLDPLATGVLLVCLGKATKQSAELMGQTKVYEAEVKLGQSTTTDDAEGDILESSPVPALSEALLLETFQRFIGEIDQIPPMFSAIKKDGKRLYKLARAGKVIEREPRKVHIHSIDLLGFELEKIHMRVTCGSGTYIRSLARDLGEALGCGAHLSGLVRTAVGSYCVEDAWDFEALKEAVLSRHEDR